MKTNLPVIILKTMVILPQVEIKLEFDDELSKNIIDEAEIFHNNSLFLITYNSDSILINDLPKVGVIAKVKQKLELPNGKVRVLIKGITRARVVEYLNPNKDILESIVFTPKTENLDEETESAIIRKLYTDLDEYTKKVPYVSNSLLSLIEGEKDLNLITDIIINNLPIDLNKKKEYLYEFSLTRRVEMILEDMYREEQLFKIENSIDNRVKKELDKDEKNFYLKEKIRVLNEELGEESPREKEINRLKEKAKNLNVENSIKEKILYEIDRYDSMSNLSPEISSERGYIDLFLNLPWNTYSMDVNDLNKVKLSLDKSHFGLELVKERIIEYLAVKQNSNNVDTPIICLVGPPGVGKTTLAKSIAKSMGRNFVKISVGGVDDESFIKGHIRTYLGSAPGRILDGIKRAKTKNPVFLIDEIDKMSNYKGDPSSALLEVLDSNQNEHFKDNYLEEEFDLSKVLFITTANDVENIPKALKDRLEIININGYSLLEKVEIVKKYLIPKISIKHGLKTIRIKDEDIINIIRYYTKESGLRELERMISKIARKIVTNKVLNNKKANLTVSNIEKYLGKRIYENELVISEVGVTQALGVSSNGGEVILVESNFYDGDGKIILTGSIGDVMLESAKVALSYIKSNYKSFGIKYSLFKNDIHINIPNISVKKEGPSAGIAITTSIISAFTNLKIGGNIAFTGEITLRGNILKVGGIKDKIIGAYLNNIDTVFIPFLNISDIEDIPLEIKNKIKIIPVKKYSEVYEYIKKISI